VSVDELFPYDNPLFRVFRTSQSVQRLVAQALGERGLSGNEYGVLGYVAKRGPFTPTVLADRLGMPPTTMSVYVARFVERGLVRKLPNPDDGRSYLVEATEEGHRLVDRIVPRIVAAERALQGELEIPVGDLMAALDALDAAARKGVDVLDEDTTTV
jgi:DNA-binding MarR family transcriptional regulator